MVTTIVSDILVNRDDETRELMGAKPRWLWWRRAILWLVVLLLFLAGGLKVYQLALRRTALSRLIESGAQPSEHSVRPGTFSMRAVAERVFGARFYQKYLMASGEIFSVNFDDSHPPSADDLQQLTFFPEISVLSLNHCPVADASLASFARLPNLEVLHISNGGITDDGIARLAGLSKLREVNLAGNDGITGVGFRNWTCTDTLTGLDLINTGMTLEGLQELRRFKKLRWLFIGSDELWDSDETEGWEVLLDLPELDTVSGLSNESAVEVWSRHPNCAKSTAKHSGESQP